MSFYNKKIVFIIWCFFTVVFIYPDILFFKSGEFLEGELLYYDFHHTIFHHKGENAYQIKNSVVDFISLFYRENGNTARLKVYKNHKRVDDLPLKITSSSLYFFRSEENVLLEEKFSTLAHLKLVSDKMNEKNLSSYEPFPYDMLSLSDIVYSLIAYLNKHNLKNWSKIDNVDISYDEMFFYEKFWNLLNEYLNPLQKDMIWQIMESFMEVEKRLIEINEAAVNIDTNSLRKGFMKRITKVIYLLN